jgi:hypothetical protein
VTLMRSLTAAEAERAHVELVRRADEREDVTNGAHIRIPCGYDALMFATARGGTWRKQVSPVCTGAPLFLRAALGEPAI